MNPASVHPRVCGEQLYGVWQCPDGDGSSPRVRGTVRRVRLVLMMVRFIPACAGNRRSRMRCGGGRSVHPRVCGEQAVVARPPRDRHRFIPACAGNSRSEFRPPGRCPVHPRVCGEQLLFQIAVPVLAGSSPRVRGTVICDENPPMRGRFIPACAGNRFFIPVLFGPVSVHPRVCGEQSGSR